jgi:hypothetical protein
MPDSLIVAAGVWIGLQLPLAVLIAKLIRRQSLRYRPVEREQGGSSKAA